MNPSELVFWIGIGFSVIAGYFLSGAILSGKNREQEAKLSYRALVTMIISLLVLIAAFFTKHN